MKIRVVLKFGFAALIAGVLVLQVASAGAALFCGWFVGGLLIGLACAAGAPAAAARTLRAARERHPRREGSNRSCRAGTRDRSRP